MDENSHTSLVIEVENQEELEDKKTYQVQFENLDNERDYVLDEVFCGENVTVYALLEVPETEVKRPKSRGMKMKNERTKEEYRFHHKNSLKYVSENPLVPKSHESAFSFLPEEINGSENLHCLKHVNGDHEMLAGDNTDLRVLYSKSSVSRHIRSTKFKAISKGVNTDIVQTPKLFQKIRKIMKLNFPKTGNQSEISENASSIFHSNVIKMGVHPSSSNSSFSSEDKKTSKNSHSDIFLIPFLLADDNMIYQLQINDKTQKIKECSAPKKISIQTSTSEMSQIKNEDSVAPAIVEPEDAEIQVNDTQKKNSKSVILNEIRQLQTRLISLIKTIELDGLKDILKEEVLESPPQIMNTCLQKPSELIKFSSKTEDENTTMLESTPAAEDEDPETDNPSLDFFHRDTKENPIKSIFTNCLPTKTVSSTVIPGDGKQSEKKPKEDNSADLVLLENKKSARLSKSTTNNTIDSKFISINGLRKSLSFDFKDNRLESCLKKIKNNFSNFDSKPNFWICDKPNGNLNCKIGGEPFVIPKQSKVELSRVVQQIEDLKTDKTDLESNVILREGDAKLVLSKETLFPNNPRIPEVEVHFCRTNDQLSESIIEIEKSVSTLPIKSNTVTEPLQNTGDTEKPAATNKNIKKLIPPLKKDIKLTKKPINTPVKLKTVEKPAKLNVQQELIKPKPLSGSRKFTLKGNAESKLQVMKQYASNSKLNEKTGGKIRPPSQKRESTESPNDNESKETTDKYAKKNSPFDVRKRDRRKTHEGAEKNKEESTTMTPIEENIHSSSGKATDVKNEVVELFSKDNEKKNLSSTKLNKNLEKNHEVNILEKDSENMEKTSVKSVWALTKVLLFEDGSKKIEILEASLTPPEHLAGKISQNN